MITFSSCKYPGFFRLLFVSLFAASSAFSQLAVDELLPASGTGSVPENTMPSIVFDQSIDRGTGLISIKRVDTDTEVISLDVTDPADVGVDTGNFDVVANLLVPASTFTTGVEYYLEVPAGAFVNLFDGNDGSPAITGKDGALPWRFTVGTETVPMDDGLPPNIVSRIPSISSTSAALNGNISITFDEIIQATGTAGNLTIHLASDDSVVETIAIGSGTITAETISFSPLTTLTVDTDYYVQLDAGLISDTFGNAFAGISGSSAWPFSTAPATAVVINKYGNGTPDIVELLVVGDGTPGNTWNLQGYIVKDFSGNIVNDNGGAYQFSTDAIWAAVPVGTLVVLTNDNTAGDIVTDPGNDDFTLRVGMQNTTYFTNVGSSSFNIATRDMVMLKAPGSDVAGTTGGVHAFASVFSGDTPGALYTDFTGPKLLGLGGSGTSNSAFANNSTASLADFSGTDATGGTPTSSLTYGSPNNGTNQAYIASLRGQDTSIGDGIATLTNQGTGPLAGSAIFPAGTSGQAADISLLAAVNSNTITKVTITLPLAFGIPVSGNISLSGAGGASASFVLSGQDIEITGAAVTTTDPLVVSFTNLTSPVADIATDAGSFPFLVATSGGAGAPGAIASSPTFTVPVPISALRTVDSNGVPVSQNKAVAVEGVATHGNFNTAQTSTFIQSDGAGINIFSFSLDTTFVRGNRYIVSGNVTQFGGLSEVAYQNGSNVIDLGADTDPSPVTITIADLLAAPETYEGLLVRINGLSYVSGTWASSSTIVLQNGLSETIDIRIQANSTATTEPTYPVDIIGVVGQFDNSSPFDTGYLLQPRDPNDLIPGMVVANDFSDWIAGFSVGGLTGLTDDADLDGIPNGVENFFGTAPDSFNSGLTPVSGSAGSFVFSHSISASPADDLTASYEWSADLENWQDSGASSGGTTVDIGSSSSAGTATVTATVSVGTADKLFLRVKVTQ